jgi:hypothetical protein
MREDLQGPRFMRLLLAFLVLALGAPTVDAASSTEAAQNVLAADRPTALSPATVYDPKIPTLKAVLGYDSGERITPPEDLVVYLKALHAAAPDRTALLEYARTWERRPLFALIVASPERIAGLAAIKRDLQRLADPRGLPPAEADAILSRAPVVTWLMHAVHGDEISSSDAALMEAYHLLAARGDAAVDAILRESMVIIDPLQNPDGRARFVSTNLQGEAATPDSEPYAVERDQPWPGGRYNHYLFDMNRDWFAQTQPETRGRSALYREFWPHVVVDLHEMGGDSSYYFAPPADPLNPHITKSQQKWFDAFGRANGAMFDARGFAYFIREVYDSFYPGYGESWPIFHGAIGMTYEQASARGLRYRREDGDTLSYRDGVLRHFTAAITTAETAAKNRAAILRDFYDYRRSAVAEGETGPVREYLLVPGADPSRAERLARLLSAQGIEVSRASEPFKAGTRSLPAGTWIVSAAQPSGRLVRNLLDKETLQPEAFIKEQDRRRTKKLGDQIYDVTAWSLPLAFDVEVVTADRPTQAAATPMAQYLAAAEAAAQAATAAPVGAPPKVGFLLPWGSATAGLVADALRQGIRLRSADLPFTLAGRAYAPGTVLARTADNAATMPAALAALARTHGVEVVRIDTAFVDSGMSLGSASMVALKAPRVVMAWDTGTQAMSAGWTRYTLERRFGQPVTAVRVASLGRVDLTRVDVLVFPSGAYAGVSGDGLRRIKDWVNAGGTLITIAEASRWAARDNIGLLSTSTELKGGKAETVETPADKPGEKKEAGSASSAPIDFEKAIQPDRERPDGTPGALFRVTLDPEHWLSSGLDGEIQAMVEGARIFTPLKLDKGRNVGIYGKGDALVASGLVWSDARNQYASKSYLMAQPVGEGHVIAFAEDPNYRAFTEATSLLFINAVLLGPAH